MAELFLKILNMSIAATWLVLAVLAVRLCLKKAPKWIHVLLWGIVAVRLLCPVSIQSVLSLIPSAEVVSPDIMMDPTPQISTGIPALNAAVNPIISESFTPTLIASANPLQIWIPIIAAVWIAGMAVMAFYTAVSYFSLRRKLRTATWLYGNIYQSARIPSPFVLGLFSPRIYLPFGMKEGDMAHVIAHEQTHIRRLDHWWKPIGFALLTVHWFNPFLWAAYILLCRDIELACDEKVIQAMGRDQRADYSQALLSCSVDRRIIAACPLAFGEVGVKERVKNVLNYKKPAFWIIILAVLLCCVMAVCFLTDPTPSREFPMDGKNVADLEPWQIVETIAEMEGLDDGSALNIAPVNFNIHLTEDFEWDDSQSVRFFYTKEQQEYSAQLRIFPEEGSFLVTAAATRLNETLIYKLYHYLQALKYLPQDAIRAMCPDAGGYIITQRAGGSPDDYERVITYTADGAQAIDGWLIHLELQPMHDTGEGLRGTGKEVIHLFYRDSTAQVEVNGQKSDIVSIVDRTVTEQLPTDEAIEVFYEDDEYVYSFASIRSHLVMVTYFDGSTESIRTAMETGRAAIEDLDRFGIHYYAEPKGIPMEPTHTNLRGLVAGYLFVPIGGSTYRYALTDAEPQSVTADRLLDSFSEETLVEGVAWEVYSLKEYPDMTKLLLISGTHSAWLCEFAPSGQAEEGALDAARADGYVIVENGVLTGNGEIWREFYESTRQGKPAFVMIAQYFTLDADRTASETYEAYKQDYPALYIHELSYDADVFVLRTEEDVRVYEYLMKYTVSGTPTVTSEKHEIIDRYVLTHDNTHTWDQLWSSLLSSAQGVAIDHYTVCTAQG